MKLQLALAVATVKFPSSVRYALGTMSYALNLAERLGSCCSRSGEISIFSNDTAQIISALAAAHPRYMAAELKISRHRIAATGNTEELHDKTRFQCVLGLR